MYFITTEYKNLSLEDAVDKRYYDSLCNRYVTSKMEQEVDANGEVRYNLINYFQQKEE